VIKRATPFHLRLLCGAAVATIASAGGTAHAQDIGHIHIEPQSLVSALNEFGVKTGQPVISTPELTASKQSPGVKDADDPAVALAQLLSGTGLSYRCSGDTYLIVPSPESGPAPKRCVAAGAGGSDGADAGTVQALIVTAQKREEQIQDVPIAISAFTEKSLQEQKIEGGFDLLKAIPNVTFSKNNFTSYNFSIRGIGTKAVSATTDPGVAVSFNNIALIQNRLFEQEYFDVERVEVLRGPQGTLYGRNATAGVINVISAKPNLHEFDGWVKGEVGNYHAKRLSAMVNVPLIEDKLGVRVAGSLTDRQGYDFNTGTHHAVNGRDLWSGRVTVQFNPTESIRSNLIWERFNEDDNRSRTGKQLCHRDPGLTQLGDMPVVPGPEVFPDKPWFVPFAATIRPALFSQGCKPGNLYEDTAFGTPNGLSLPFVLGMITLGAAPGPYCDGIAPLGCDSTGAARTLIKAEDPYGGMMQSRDLRVINSFRDPVYRARADVVELNVDFDLTHALSFASQTAYNKDTTYSFQDYNRFNTVPIFTDTSQLYRSNICDSSDPVTGVGTDCHGTGGPSLYAALAPGGLFCDPQIGCSSSLAGFDVAQAKGEQFSEEIRLQSDFKGPVNFSAGINYTRFRTLVDYYVFYNLITALAEIQPLYLPYFDGQNTVVDPTRCGQLADNGLHTVVGGVDTATTPNALCPYIDPKPVENITGDGHNYFRSKNPYRLKSWAAFGELYWQTTDTVKVTAGLRYTDDRKHFIPVPSQVLLAPGQFAGGTTNRGYPEKPAINQHWGEVTGRLGVDWKPDLSFTDQTLLYAFYSRGYKGGGANPPTPGFATTDETAAMLGWTGELKDYFIFRGVLPVIALRGAEYGPTFKPEFVNAFELGAKNTLLGGGLVLNSDAFFYDYKDYQVSQIRDRSAVNENFDAKIWGLELETLFSPSRNLHINANLGYLDTRIGDGATSIDLMNRTQGNPNYVLVKPWIQQTSNCIAPLGVVQNLIEADNSGETPSVLGGYWQICGGGGILNLFSSPLTDPNFNNERYDPANYPEINGGAGIKAQLGGNELPNSPHWTMNIGAQYGFDILEGWRATVRGDAYWQSQSWARVYDDDPYDKLHGWYNVNLSVWLERPEDDLKIEFYAKNLLDKTPITDAFLNSDDTALTTNVFVLDPRLIGLSIRKGF